MNMREIREVRIAEDYTPYLGGRLKRDGPGSGEEFRDNYLLPALREGLSVKVILDGAYGYPISFLEEAFGGLIRVGLSLNDIRSSLEIVSGDKAFNSYVGAIWRLIEEEASTLKHSESS